MNLLHIKDIALKYSQAISTILDIDVVIIDSEYNKLAYTSKNISNQLPITRMSVIGEVLHTGKVLIVQDNGKYPICTNCVDSSVCKISGIISVPIIYNDRPVGAVALLIPKNIKSTIFENMEPAIDFVESMADLLSFRLQNIADYDNLNKTKHERETVINTIDDGLVALNKDGEVSFCNNQFLKYFHITKDIIGLKLEEIMTHEKLDEILVAPEDKMVRSLFLEDRNTVFRGIVSKRNITINGVKIGVLLSFKSLRDSYSNFSSVLDQYETMTFERVKTKDPIIHTLIDKAKALAVRDRNLLIQSETGLEIFGMARSIHNFSDRASERFTTVHCANKSYSDLEMDLFGEENNPLFGVLNLANHGTVLVYDVDEMPLYLQQ
ncbi:MAG TPA: sigma 54-interacting transcriptional regulator, partial [Clostridiaceae bacterium]|nr:sigma 54-interacting transcriptional regulator [Clostridiaceae bacterium]